MKLRITPALLASFTLGLISSHGTPIAHYKFDETSGTTAADELGSSNATIEGTVGFVAGVDGGAFSFDGNTANNVTVANAPFLSGAGLGGDFTISVWVSFTDVSTNVATMVTLVEQSTATAHAYTDLSRIGNNAFGGGIDGSFLGRTRGGGITQSSGGGAFNDGNFHHVAFVVDSANEIQRIYVDGNSVNFVEGSPFLQDFTDLTIGHLDRPDGAGQTDVDAFNGTIDDVQIYAEALDQAAVTFLFNNPGETFDNDDIDGDGLLDAWEIFYGLDPNDDGTTGESSPGAKDGPNGALGDPDGDGLTNTQEFDPTQGPNPLSPPTDPMLGDTDDDGLSDLVENNTGVWEDTDATGTDPTVADTDGDGLEDGLENPDSAYLAGENPGSDPNLVDSDSDGYTDGFEFQTAGTNPADGTAFPMPSPLIAHEDFSYPDGPLVDLDGGAGWAGPWAVGPGGYNVVSGQAVGALDLANNQAFRPIQPIANGRVYFSFSGEIPNIAPDTGGGFPVGGVSVYSGGTEWSFLGFRNDFFRLDGAASGDANDQNTGPGTSVANTRTAFVLEVILDPAPGAPETFNAWIFTDGFLPPTLPETPDMTASYNIGDAVALDRLRLFDNENVIATWDDLAVASTYAAIPKGGELAITDVTVTPPDDVSITFNSIPGNLYDIEQSLALSQFGSIGTIVATGPTTTFTRSGVELETREFFRVEDLGEAPPLLSEDFEADDGGFTTQDKSPAGSGSDWTRGAPVSVGVAGNQVTSGNEESTNAFGTDISNPGYVAFGTETCLRSPVIDLTGVESASLRFAEALDIESVDLAEVWIIEGDTDAPIGDAPIHASQDENLSASAWAGVGPIVIPAAALGRQVRIEWRFTKVGTGTDFLGWFIDDVELTRP